MSDSTYVLAGHISKTFESQGRPLRALEGVNLSVRKGELLSIIGPSGCGKTTLLRIIGGLAKPSAGQVTIGGEEPEEAQARKEIGFVFQDAAILPWRTVLDNVRLPLQVNRGASPSPGAEGLGRGVRRGARGEVASQLVEAVGLKDFAGYYPHQLSGGMRQRVALARALVFDPALLLMDEPLGSLDEITRGGMRYELLRLWEQSGKTVIMVTHSIPEAIILSDRVAVMSSLPGRILQVLDIAIPRPRDERIERSPAFLDYADAIRGLLAGAPLKGVR